MNFNVHVFYKIIISNKFGFILETSLFLYIKAFMEKSYNTFGEMQGILKGEVSLFHWPPVWLVWISLFCKQKQKLSVVIQLIPNQSNRRSMVQRYPTLVFLVKCSFFVTWATGSENFCQWLGKRRKSGEK